MYFILSEGPLLIHEARQFCPEPDESIPPPPVLFLYDGMLLYNTPITGYNIQAVSLLQVSQPKYCACL